VSEKIILLASGSPRRRELLERLGLPFERTSADIDEAVREGEAAADYTIRLSQEKAQAALKHAPENRIVLAADTTVADGPAILGKPVDADDARAMLKQLRGRTHQVYTALTLIEVGTGRSVTDVAVTDVPMRNYSDEEIEAYIASGDPFDKAGGYAIQNAAFHPVNALSGCYSNVVGLPMCRLVRALRQLGVEPTVDLHAICWTQFDYDCPAVGEA